MRLELDNILCFDNFEADFSYPKKLVNSSLDGEYLQNYPSIRYKKVNILIGSNASGKTSLGKAIWQIFRFLNNKESNGIRKMVSDTSRDARFLIDCVFAEGTFLRFECVLKADGSIVAKLWNEQLLKDDTYNAVVDRLIDKPFDNYLTVLENLEFGGWNFAFPTIESGFDVIYCKYDDPEEFLKVFKKVLKTFDPSIKEVFKSEEQEDTYIIKLFNNKTIAIKHGEKISGLNLLSSGTKYAINIAGLMYSIKKHQNGFYYADEQFSYVNSDIEIACLTTMIEMLGDGEQLFFTTHNTELLALSLPNHSFSFLKKENNGNDRFVISLVDAAKYEKRNNVNIKNLYDNDYFDVAPNTQSVFSIGN